MNPYCKLLKETWGSCEGKFPWHIKLVFHFFLYKYLISFSCHFNNLKWWKNEEPFLYSYWCYRYTFLSVFSDKLFVGLFGVEKGKIVCCFNILIIMGWSLTVRLKFKEMSFFRMENFKGGDFLVFSQNP